jgi:hypothetical protein
VENFVTYLLTLSLITSDSPFPWVMGPDTAGQSARFRVLKGKGHTNSDEQQQQQQQQVEQQPDLSPLFHLFIYL